MVNPVIVKDAWAGLRPSLVLIREAGATTGVAAKIANGRYLAMRRTFNGDSVIGIAPDGSTIDLTLKSLDGRTQLCLLVGPDIPGLPFQMPLDPSPGALTALTNDGAVSAQIKGTPRLGYQKGSNGALPLLEVRLEGRVDVPDNALFVSGGRLQGAVVSLPRISRTTAANIGPAPLTVTYILSPQIMKRVWVGFRSPDAKVVHPYFGVVVRDAPSGGALVVSTDPGSPARRAGLMVDDVILKIGTFVIDRQTDFSRAVLELEPGRLIMVQIKRNGMTMGLSLMVGGVSD